MEFLKYSQCTYHANMYVYVVTGYNEFVNNQDQVSSCAIGFSMLLYQDYSYN